MPLKVSIIDNKPCSAMTVASARSCYGEKPVKPSKDENPKLLKDLFRSGHHTTFQHKPYTFLFNGVSRYLVWAFLHDQRFYNTSQVSQRYVRMDPSGIFIPSGMTQEQETRYKELMAFSFKTYRALADDLQKNASRAYFKRFEHRSTDDPKWQRVPVQIAQENARYVLPLAVLCHMYYTIDVITLLRLKSVCRTPSFEEEALPLVQAMIGAVLKKDAGLQQQFDAVQEDSMEFSGVYDPEETEEANLIFDQEVLGPKHQYSKMIGYFPTDVTFALQDPWLRYLDRIGLSPTFPIPSDQHALNIDPVSKDAGMVGNYFRYAFAKKHSLSCDAQQQRHRVIDRNVPHLLNQIGTSDDFYVPSLLVGSERYQEAMGTMMKGFRDLIEMGVAPEKALYVIPNGVNIRLMEVASLNGFRHKAKTRICFNAQEEIWRSVIEEIQQVAHVHRDVLGDAFDLYPTCKLRAMRGEDPPCLEGDRYCGVQLWRYDFEEIMEMERSY